MLNTYPIYSKPFGVCNPYFVEESINNLSIRRINLSEIVLIWENDQFIG
jgi:hypothetical protein